MTFTEAPLRGVIAVDGPAGAGKSTVAEELARRLGGVRLDTGAIYRTLALLARERGVPWSDGEALGVLADALELRFESGEQVQRVLVGDRDVTADIRTPDISRGASEVSQHGAVRAALLKIQRRLGARGLVVAEGRDMGTAVFPDALMKFFLVADPEIRARRRWLELRDRGVEAELEEVLRDQLARDAVDTQRAESPLRRATDAVEVDSTGLSIDEVVDKLAQLVKKIFSETADGR